MNMQETLLRIQQIFRDVFDDPELEVTEQTSARDIPAWDSLATIGLIFALEQEFQIKFALGEIQELKCVGDMAHLIRKRRNAAAV